MSTYRKSKDYYRNYEEKRRNEGKIVKRRMRYLRKVIRRRIASEFAPATGISESALYIGTVILVHKAKYKLSYRQLATEFASSSALCSMCGLDYAPSKSTLHALASKVSMAGKEFMDAVLSSMVTEGDSTQDLHGDSSGFGLRKYVDWHNAKYGDGSRRDFVKLHLITAVNGLILALEVTGAHAHDSPRFRDMIRKVPHGSSCSGMVALDAAYYARSNCNMIKESNRVSVIKPKRNSVPRGNSVIAKMTRWYVEQRDDFMTSYGKRNMAESVFSAIKERTGTMIRAKSLFSQTAELFARVLYYNLTVY